MGIKLYYTTVTASREINGFTNNAKSTVLLKTSLKLELNLNNVIGDLTNANETIKSQQAEVMRILDSKSIKYDLIDISVGGDVREEMRTKSGNPTAIPPQIFNEDKYCGNYEMFSEAVESDSVEQFLKLA